MPLWLCCYSPYSAEPPTLNQTLGNAIGASLTAANGESFPTIVGGEQLARSKAETNVTRIEYTTTGEAQPVTNVAVSGEDIAEVTVLSVEAQSTVPLGVQTNQAHSHTSNYPTTAGLLLVVLAIMTMSAAVQRRMTQ